MLLAKRNQDLVPSLFNELLNMNWGESEPEHCGAMPKMNVAESELEYHLELCVPGLSKENLKISIDGENNLVVEALPKAKESVDEESAEDTHKTESCHYLRREFGTLQFKQIIELPENVKKDSISACAENGILSVTLPKYSEKEKQAMLQQIEIQ